MDSERNDSERSFGQWRVSDVTGYEIPKKLIVELVLGDDGLVLSRPDGSEGFLFSYLEVFAGTGNPRKTTLMTDTGRVWLEAEGRARNDGLREELEARREAARPEGPDAPLDPVVVFSYPGRTQADAAEAFARHATVLAADGYTPVSQSWAEGRAGVGRVMMLGVGASMIKPNGFLTVTYVLREARPALGAPAPAADDTMPCPRCAETIKRAAKMCRFCQLDLTQLPNSP